MPQLAKELGCSPQSLRNWARQLDVDEGSIEVFFNRRRRHSTLGFLSPAQFETTTHTQIETTTTTAAAVA